MNQNFTYFVYTKILFVHTVSTQAYTKIPCDLVCCLITYSSWKYFSLIVILISKGQICRIFFISLNISTPTKSSWDGVKYYYHFHKDFLPPYGTGHNQTSFSDKQMEARLSQINCEFLTQPWIAVSEFSDTVLSNMSHLQKSSGILDEASMNRFF